MVVGMAHVILPLLDKQPGDSGLALLAADVIDCCHAERDMLLFAHKEHSWTIAEVSLVLHLSLVMPWQA